MQKPSPLVLDTHIWIWLMDGAVDKLPAPVRTKIATAAKQGLICISAISIWEVAMLEAKKKIVFSVECRTWIDRALEAPGVQLAHLSPAIMIDSARLPGELHGDPADRMLIATARSMNGILVTKDSRILDYAAGGFVKALGTES